MAGNHSRHYTYGEKVTPPPHLKANYPLPLFEAICTVCMYVCENLL